MPASLSIVIPALDEADGILPALDDLCASLDPLVTAGVLASYEVLVVDDGSTDDTARLVAERARADPSVSLLSHPTNLGVGAAVRSGIARATGDLVLYTDADMPVDLAAVARALPILAEPGVGLVAGRRRSYRAEGSFRAAMSLLFDAVARVVLGVRERDVNFPFKLLEADLARRLDLRSDGALADVELLARVHQAGLEVRQLTLDYRDRVHGESKTMTIRLLRRLAVELVRNGPSIRRPSKP